MSTQPPFIPVGALAEGFAPESNILASVSDLAGRTIQLDFGGGTLETLSFPGVERIRFGESDFSCRVTSLRSSVYFVDFIGGGDTRPSATTSLVLDMGKGLVTSVVGLLPSESEARIDAIARVERGLPLTSVSVRIRHGRILTDGMHLETPLHAPTDDLIGKRVLYDYSATERYEHVYLNRNLYAWHCLSGVEAELADVDQCYYIAIAEQLYLFIWCEKIIPTVGIILIDFERRKTDGKLVGYEGTDFGKLSNFPVGAHLQVLNETRYSE
ncbi:moaF [Caballeronia hypogeia]|uniref:MoaF n=1 Tax=Caballeronia hypogeia TaxID=1777140 RepID=A0A158CYP8_9BURK|nr:MoaF C-terminal domain-containing protein [Caballeronia hypogeia]SAK87484.1 moaF [Caballeronia hypogeia]